MNPSLLLALSGWCNGDDAVKESRHSFCVVILPVKRVTLYAAPDDYNDMLSYAVFSVEMCKHCFHNNCNLP
jgi:hypothetical protein